MTTQQRKPTTQHIPTPLRLGSVHSGTQNVLTMRGELVATFQNVGGVYDATTLASTYITAINAHDALIEACEAYEDFISLWQDALLRNMTKTMLDDQLALPRKFLKLAKGGEQ